ncbi:hypothetical protein pdam_00004920 [Pocillopora damicornis]|uniref:Uncharacterized protein n=1 Tax=Pocillopora damicornis TaxID=46731 RepID=A0A3M6TLS7_POCDA|nr:hypothetical protein pdam_00004920 [Pocillopora damicornis]
MESVDKETESMPQKKRAIRRGPRPTSVKEKEPSKTEIIWMAASYFGRMMLLLEEEGTQTQAAQKNDA